MIPLPAMKRWPLAAALLSLAACTTVGPQHTPPEAKVPAAFHEADAQVPATPADLTAWWRTLGDPVLDGLVDRALRQSLDLGEALARVDEARALRGGAAAGLRPTLDALAGYQRRGESENTPLGNFAVDSDRYTLGLESSWELDLWGRLRRGVEAADADLDARIETARGVWVSVAAEVATQYVLLRSAQERVAIARNNLTLQQQTLGIVQARFDSGLVGERDLAQARRNLATTRARVPAIEAEVRTAENRLAVLLGTAPGSLAQELAAAGTIPVAPDAIAVGVPMDVVRNRPDVRAAERELAAATARIGVAEADLYPRLVLFGSVGLEADHISDLFDGSSSVLAVGPSVRWNLFDGGRVRRRIAAEGARAQQALLRWERTVLVALEEAENAMTALVRERARRGHLDTAAAEARRAQQFATTQYREGLADFQTVLDSERTMADLEDELARSRGAITGHAIRLYRALGGGWQGGAEHGPDSQG